MKKAYISPEIEFIKFEVDDIITASGLATLPGDNEFTAPTGWWS